MSQNHLSDETSPYLRQHKDNPVHWYAWGPAALKAAKEQNKPILLSVGYSACHWCHVMAHESFEDVETAEVMNDLYINIKVDREERPDLDHIYQTALHLLGQQGGWPLTMFLKPDGQPFWGGTYFPNQPRQGMPSFVSVLTQISDTFHNRPEQVDQNGTGLMERLKKLSEHQNDGDLPDNYTTSVSRDYISYMDPTRGGLGGAPKFPQPPILRFLWQKYLLNGDQEIKNSLIKTITHICQGGIYDHVGGGFARYSVDERWLVPHFEKMLYDNAQLIELMCLIYQETHSPLLNDRVQETITWLLREMTDEHGGFYAALDADSEGEEGKFYIWKIDELIPLLDENIKDDFLKYYDATPHGNWEGNIILNRLNSLEYADDLEHDFRKILDHLRLNRNLRERPGLDHKILADWNGMTINAVALAGQIFRLPEWLDAAEKAYHFVMDKMTDQKNGQLILYHAHCVGQNGALGMLEDYSQMANAALILYQITAEKIYLKDIMKLIDQIILQFQDQENGGYFQTSNTVDDVVMRSKTSQDNVTPAANNQLIEIFAKIWLLTGDVKYRDLCEQQLQTLSGTVLKNYYGGASYFSGLDLYHNALQIVLVGGQDHVELNKWRNCTFKKPLPSMVFQHIEDTSKLDTQHPAYGKISETGKLTAYICQNQTCGLPITEFKQFEETLDLLKNPLKE